MGIDHAILDFIRNNLTADWLDGLMVFVSWLGNAGAIWAVLALVFLCFKNTRPLGIILFIALIGCLIVGNLTLKPLFARPRPFEVFNVPLIIPAPHGFSFPSGHTMAAFACAFCIGAWNKRWGVAAWTLGILISFSRMYLYVHFPTDILAGAVIGLAIGYTARWAAGKLPVSKCFK